jgi:hypothetical protein
MSTQPEEPDPAENARQQRAEGASSAEIRAGRAKLRAERETKREAA